MASTLDSAVGQINNDLKIATSKAVRDVVKDILKGKTIDPTVVTKVVDTVVNRAVGNILNTATQSVNKTVSKALGKTFKNSPLNVIAGNYVANVLTSVITGKQTPAMTVKMTNSISQGISRELYSKLPPGITKNIKIDILGTKFSAGLSGIVGKAINDTVKAVVESVFSNTSSASKVSIPNINKIPSIVSIPDKLPDLATLPTNLSGLTTSIADLSDKVGSYANTVVSSLSGIEDLKIVDIQIPAGLDLSRITSANNGLGKMIQLASTGLGQASKITGLSKADFTEIQAELKKSNINNPLLKLGGTFANIEKAISGGVTLSGLRSITKDMTSKLSDINDSFSVMSEEDKKSKETIESNTLEISKVVAKQAVENATNFNTLSEDQLNKLTATKQGFQDPNAKFPLSDYSSRSEVNKLSTGDVDNTIVDKKNANRMLGAQLPNGAKWDQPVSSYNAKYPYNKVTETESGHITEIDDTPGAERLHIAHKTGTSIEIDPVGNKIQVIKGSDYTIIDANGYISIQGKANVSINGSCNVYINSDANIEVNGNTAINCHNNIEMNAAGRLKLTAGEGIDIKSPEVYIDADNQFQLNADVSAKLHVKEFNMIVDTDMKTEVHNDYRLSVTNNSDVHVGGVTKHHSTGDIHSNTDGSAYHSAKGDTHIKSIGSLFNESVNYNVKASGAGFFTFAGVMNNKASQILEQCGGWAMSAGGGVMSASGGNMSFNTSGTFAIDSSSMHLNSGVSSTTGDLPEQAQEAIQASQAVTAGALETEYSDASYMTGRKSINETQIPDSFVKEMNAAKVMTNITPAIISNQQSINDETKATIIEDHNITTDAIDKKPIILEKASLQLHEVKTIIPDELPLGDTVIPANFKLSPYFTVGSFTTDAIDSTKLSPVGDVMELSKVVSNLQYIALNVLEPIYAVRPDVIIHTGFVPVTENQQQFNRFNFGLAVTIDFKNANSFDDYYDIAKIISQIIPFDELTVVYLSADFTGSHNESGSIIIKVPGVFYPNVTDVANAETLQQWVNSNNKKILRTWFNSKLVDANNLVKLA